MPCVIPELGRLAGLGLYRDFYFNITEMARGSPSSWDS